VNSGHRNLKFESLDLGMIPSRTQGVEIGLLEHERTQS
jgi:hypothetical protein